MTLDEDDDEDFKNTFNLLCAQQQPFCSDPDPAADSLFSCIPSDHPLLLNFTNPTATLPSSPPLLLPLPTSSTTTATDTAIDDDAGAAAQTFQRQASKTRRRVGRPRSTTATTTTTTTTDGDVCKSSKGAATTTTTTTSTTHIATIGKKRGRGPKPKYIFATTDEAQDARKERNRKAALESYYKKRQQKLAMEEEAKQLAAENAALEQLLNELETGVTQLHEASDDGIDVWLQSHA